jgi:hypothetical protein
MQIHQLEVKLFVDGEGAALDQAALIPIFHRWIRDDAFGKDVLLIDVADYRHVPDGPGVMLVADGAQWRVDEGEGQVGLLFARKRDEPGDAADKLAEAYRRALTACQLLEKEPSLGGVRFRADRSRITVMSRLVADGDGASYSAFEPAVRAFGARLFPTATLELEHVNRPREALTVELRASAAPRAVELLARLS